MITSRFLVVAERVIRDIETKSLSIINIIDDIAAETYPLAVQRMFVVASLERDDDDDSIQLLRFKVDNNSVAITEDSIRVDFRNKRNARAIIELGGILLQEPGKAHFILLLNDNEVDRYTINLKVRNEVKVSS